jgi:ribonuclease P protein component
VGPGRAVAPAEEGPEAADRADSQQARGILTADQRVRRSHRLTTSAEVRQVLERGRRRRLDHLDVLWSDNSAGHPRLGLIVPKFQLTGVARNRLRRRLREIWRRELKPVQGSRDLLIRARRGAYDASFSELRDQLTSWCRDGVLT